MSDKRLHGIIGGFAAALLVTSSALAASVTCVGPDDWAALDACANAGDGSCQVDGDCVIGNGLVVTVPVRLFSDSGASITRAFGSTIWLNAAASGSEITGLTIESTAGGTAIRQSTGNFVNDVIIRYNTVKGGRGIQQFASAPLPPPDELAVPHGWVIEGNTIVSTDGGSFAILLGGSDNLVNDNMISGTLTGLSIQAQISGGGRGNQITHNTVRIVQTPLTANVNYPRPLFFGAYGAVAGGNNYAHNCVEAVHFGLIGAQSAILFQDQTGVDNLWQHNDGTGSSQFGTNGAIGLLSTAGSQNSVFIHNDLEGVNPAIYGSGTTTGNALFLFTKTGSVTLDSWFVTPNLPWFAINFGTGAPNVFADLQTCDGFYGEGAGGTATFLIDRWRADLRCQQDPDSQPTRDCAAKSGSGDFWSADGEAFTGSRVEGLVQTIPESELMMDAIADIAGDTPYPSAPRTSARDLRSGLTR